jgi:hypothetical protein
MHLLLDVLANLIVDLQFLLKIVELIFANLSRLDRLFARSNRR